MGKAQAAARTQGTNCSPQSEATTRHSWKRWGRASGQICIHVQLKIKNLHEISISHRCQCQSGCSNYFLLDYKVKMRQEETSHGKSSQRWTSHLSPGDAVTEFCSVGWLEQNKKQKNWDACRLDDKPSQWVLPPKHWTKRTLWRMSAAGRCFSQRGRVPWALWWFVFSSY